MEWRGWKFKFWPWIFRASMLQRRIHASYLIPRWYGIAYHIYGTDTAIVAIMPLNWILGWWYHFCIWFRKGPGESGYMKAFYEGYDRGKEAGRHEGYLQAYKEIH